MERQKHTALERADKKEARFRTKASQQDADKASGPGASPIDVDSALSVGAHAIMLSKAQSDESRADITAQLQRSYGNSYVQRLVGSLGAEGDPETQHLGAEGGGSVLVNGPTHAVRISAPAGIQRMTPGRPAAPGVEEETAETPPGTISSAVASAHEQAIASGPADGQAAEQGTSAAISSGVAAAQEQATADAASSGQAAEQAAGPGTISSGVAAAQEQVAAAATASGQTPEQAGAAPAQTADPARAALRALFEAQVLGSLREAHAVLTGSDPEQIRAEGAIDLVGRAKDTVGTIRSSYRDNPELFGHLVWWHSRMETVMAGLLARAGQGLSIEQLARLIEPSPENESFAALAGIGQQL